jgi:sec-independent protein translocase protein TatA
MGLENPLHIAVLVVLVLLVFGAKRLPEIGRSLGTGMREFKDSISGDSKQPTLTHTAQPQQPPPAAAQQPAAQAFGDPPAEQAQAPAEPTHQA